MFSYSSALSRSTSVRGRLLYNVAICLCNFGTHRSVLLDLLVVRKSPHTRLAGSARHRAARFTPETVFLLAVITGASDGIGKGYAEYLAGRRMNIVLVARNENKLNRVAEAIQRKYSVRTKVVVADFANGEAVYEHLARELLPLDVGILVNNVGLSYDRGMCMEELPKKLVWDLLTVNVASVTMLCHLLVPAMKQRGRGLIINISSLSASAPAPYLSVYAAAKVYVRNFSMALREELRPHRVEVQTVLPGFVRTNMTAFVASEYDGKAASKQLVRVDDYVRYAGFTIGKTDRTCGYWWHGLQYAGLKLVPEFVRVFVLQTIYSHLRGAKKNV